jgi:hypothetical protein
MNQRPTIRPRCRSTKDLKDRGSIIVAMMISLVLVTLGTAVAYAVIGNMGVVLTRQNTAQGVTLADAAVSDALFRLDQGTAATGTDVPYFCVQEGNSNCVADGPSPIPGADGASYIATPNNQANPTVWTIKAKGTVHGQTGAVEETVTRTDAYPFALFAKDQLIVDGNSSSDWSTYSAGDDTLNHSSNLDIGTDGQLKCTGGGFPSNVTALYYRANGSSNTYTCGSPVSTQYVFSTPTAPPGATPCPYTDFGSTFDHQTLPAGTYVCSSPITISGVLTPTGPVQLYVILPSPLSQSTNAVDIASGSYINDQYDYCKDKSNTPVGCPAGLPTATNFELFTNSDGTVGDANGQGYDFGGILYAPAASATEDGCKSNYYGSVVLGSFTCNGSPNYTFNYDNELNQVYGPWVTGSYAQISPSSVDIPTP